MTTPHAIECTLPLRLRDRTGRQSMPAGPAPSAFLAARPGDALSRSRAARCAPHGSALRYEQLLRTGTVRDYVTLANLEEVSRGRITQIMNLRQLCARYPGADSIPAAGAARQRSDPPTPASASGRNP